MPPQQLLINLKKSSCNLSVPHIHSNQPNIANIVIIGMTGSGKSTLARIIAKATGRNLIDTDDEITKETNKKIATIIALYGEEYLRNLETKIIKNAAHTQNSVIALGEGAVLRYENIQALKETSYLYLIDIPLEKLTPQKDSPYTKTKEEIKKLYYARYPLYKKYADYDARTLIPLYFQCKCCGNCCRIKSGIVRIQNEEITKISTFLNVKESDFIEKYLDISPDRQSLILKNKPDDACIFLTKENLCAINEVKPEQCKTFPFSWSPSRLPCKEYN